MGRRVRQLDRAGPLPGGIAGTILGGMAGAALGGPLFPLAVGRGVEGFDIGGLVIALFGATLLLTVLRKAGYSERRRDEE